MLDPDMPSQAMRLAMGELNGGEMRAARAAIAWANTTAVADLKKRLVKRLEEAAFNPTYDDRLGKFVPIDVATTLVHEIMGE